MQLPPALHTLLQQRIDRGADAEHRLQQLVALAFDANGLDLQYDPKATHSVAESYATRHVNCLSFTLLFVAMARDIGLQAQVQEVRRVLSWYEDGNALYNVGHVNAGVRVDSGRGSIDLDRSVLMDRRGPQPISDRRALAHYYNNRGAELMVDGDVDGARAHLAMALQMDPRFAGAWNNQGVLAMRDGDSTAAARDYAKALEIDPEHLPALSNAVGLARRLGDGTREAALQRQMEQVRQRDPFQQYLLGNEAERRQDYAAAIAYYRHALHLYDGAHLLYFALARAYLHSGDTRRATAALREAMAHADPATQPRYQGKLDALRRLSSTARPLR
ncbi:tetratricopeptide repeat protein [Xanthomonas sacchari]|uniref:tetratricopeptide repeat protein n=1 Tax=Xanthomonas sacchari TaxID=56458 RepID=UPI002254EEC4|nr:tetratricopeptide repeat protein [Xanthomonas sacchari]MCW0396097.1 Lipopolysaccharide assembly protein B [Xanthomonas sacchari]MCW0435350.1 Lipopolysaccharide assembly protein B [Xanthomonas sacchari]MCW0445679.1 Lipopolysaccharide assembly protein B [Xanthomonas sacchari]